MYTMYSLISLLNFRQEMRLATCLVGSEYIVVSALCRYICFQYINVLHLPDLSWTGNFQESNLSCLKLRLEDFILLSDKVPSLPIFNTHIFSEWNFVSPVSLSWSVFWISRLLWVVFPWPHGSKSAGTSAPVILIEGCSDHCSRNQAWFKNQDRKNSLSLSLSFRAACFVSEWTILFIIRTLDRLYQWMDIYRTKMSSLNFYSYTTPSDDFS